MNETELKLTLLLKDFLDIHLNGHDNNYIPPKYGELIAYIDSKETICHVEFYEKGRLYFEIPFEKNPTKENPAVLWRINAWRRSENLYKIRKEQAEINLAKDFARKEKWLKLRNAIIEKTSLPEEMADDIVAKIIDNLVACKNFGVD